MAITAKHFPTHAGAHSDSHTEFAVDNRELADLDDDLKPYRDLIANGLAAVMVAHVSFPAVDSRPASLSSWWIGQYLRGELEFKGAVISDDLSMTGASVVGSAAAARAARARSRLRSRAALQRAGAGSRACSTR